MIRAANLLFAVFALAACTSTGTVREGVDANGDVRVVEGVDPEYALYVDAQRALLAQQQQAYAAFAQLAAACTDSRCVENVSGDAALAMAVSAGKTGNVQPFVAQPSGWERFGLALVGQLSPIASAAVAWHASDNQTRTNEAMYDFLGGVVSSGAGAAAAIANAGPRIEVGGDYTGGDRTDTSTSVGRDQTGGDHQDGSLVGDGNRIDSPDYNCTAGNGATGGNGGNGGGASSAAGAAGAAGGTGGNCGG